MHVLPYKYLFKVKVDTPKVRIVAMGNLQVHGVDYNETFAPVVKLTSIRIFLATVAVMDLETGQMDVVTAFLNGDLDIDIFMETPDGFKDPKRPDLVCKLRKALYGLKQAPRQWYAKIHSFLVDELGFKSSPNDPCMYSRHSSSSIMLIALYVDDMLIAANSSASIKKIKEEFNMRFEMKDMGEAHICLGLEIHRDRPNRRLHNNPLSLIPGDLAGDVPYRQAVGSLMYLMRVLRYIAGTRDRGLLFGGNQSLVPVGYSDSDWGGCLETRKSTSGYVFMLAGGAVS
eukprot:IDg752t1